VTIFLSVIDAAYAMAQEFVFVKHSLSKGVCEELHSKGGEQYANFRPPRDALPAPLVLSTKAMAPPRRTPYIDTGKLNIRTASGLAPPR
jgi:hypothetical protein